ncbi:MAG: hypothetical protein ACLGH2_03895 [Gammaproteobacteria bacterium]
MAQAKFLRPVAPAEMLVFRLTDTPRGALGFEIRCGDELVATGVLQQEVR